MPHPLRIEPRLLRTVRGRGRGGPPPGRRASRQVTGRGITRRAAAGA